MTDDDEDKKEPLHKNFYVKVIFVFLLVVSFYYIFSPYENCLREKDGNPKKMVFCNRITNW